MDRYIKSAQHELFQGSAGGLRYSSPSALNPEILTEMDSEMEVGIMKKEEMFRTLANCGLNDYESRVYASLVQMGISKAGSISKDSGVPQSKIYEILESLVCKQMVEVFEGRPKEFKAIEPKSALSSILEERTKNIDNLKEDVDRLSSFLKPAIKDQVIGGIWTTKGEKFKEFFNKTIEMIDRSEKYVYGITRDFSRSSDIGDSMKKCIRRGVKIRLIGMEPLIGNNYYKAKWYSNHGAEIRIFETKVHPRIIVTDGREILLRLDYNTQKRDRFLFSSIWSEDKSLVNVIDSYVKNMWKNATPARFRKAS